MAFGLLDDHRHRDHFADRRHGARPAHSSRAFPAEQRDRGAETAGLLVALLMTIFGFAGVFTAFTYIKPILVDISVFPSIRSLTFSSCSASGLRSGTFTAASWPTAR